jgi:cyclopropane fatty-acyl-phospholipid synthase-like methyltransferase
MSDGPALDFEAAYRNGAAPWDIGRAQGAVAALAEAGRIVGSVLDVGCGTGENALFLAARGHAVMGLDASATAIALARRKAAERGLAGAQFHLWDALQLARLRKSFDTILDCGLFHTLADGQRRLYAQSLAEVAPSGSDLFLLCFSDAEPPGPGPRRIEEYQIRDAFRSIFAVMEVEPARFERRGAEAARAWLARLTKI